MRVTYRCTEKKNPRISKTLFLNFVIFSEKLYGSRLFDMQIRYEKVSHAHVRQLTVYLQ